MLKIREALNGSIIWENSGPGHASYQLGILGILLTDNGAEYERLLVGYLDFMRMVYCDHPNQLNVTKTEVQSHLKLSDSDAMLLGELIPIANLFSSTASQGTHDWQVGGSQSGSILNVWEVKAGQYLMFVVCN